MIRRYWPFIVIAVVACLAAGAMLLRSPVAPAPVTEARAIASRPPVAAAAPAAPSPEKPARQPAGYDHYRAEMKRIRAETDKAKALQANERCIGGQRFRKVGSAWERAGNC
jgi:hypothetical protein